MLKAHEGFTGDAVTSDANLARVARRRKQASYEAAETSVKLVVEAPAIYFQVGQSPAGKMELSHTQRDPAGSSLRCSHCQITPLKS